MSYNAIVFKILIASPGGTAVENDVIFEAVSNWNKTYSEKLKIVLLPMEFSADENALEECDILAAAFWTRLCPLLGENLGESLERIDEFVESGKTALLFFCTKPADDDSVDTKQYRAVKKFGEVCKTDGLYESYDDAENLREKFYALLQSKMKELALNKTDAEDKEIIKAVKPEVKEKAKEIKTEVKADEDKPPAEKKKTLKSVKESLPDTEREMVIVEYNDYIDIPQQKAHAPSLSDNASTLLKEAALDQNGSIVRKSSINGTTIKTNKKNFIKNNDKFDIVKWEAALRELEHKGLIQDRNYTGEYRLTAEGNRVAGLV